jgi:hypothetical protein
LSKHFSARAGGSIGVNVRRSLILIPALCIALLAALAAAPAAPGAKSVDKQAQSTCAQERKAIGRKAFVKRYGEGPRGMQACVRRTRAKVRAAQRAAEQSCQAELAALGLTQFIEDYGTDDSGWDAMSNCVAETADGILVPGDDSVDEELEEEEA